jgi:hypothetical protein
MGHMHTVPDVGRGKGSEEKREEAWAVLLVAVCAALSSTAHAL